MKTQKWFDIYVDVYLFGLNNMGMLSVPVTYALMIFGNVAHTLVPISKPCPAYNHCAVVDHGTL